MSTLIWCTATWNICGIRFIYKLHLSFALLNCRHIAKWYGNKIGFSITLLKNKLNQEFKKSLVNSETGKAEGTVSASWLFFSSSSCLSFESRFLPSTSSCSLNPGPHWTNVIHMLTFAYILFVRVSSAELWPHHTYFPTACYLYHRKARLEIK